MEDRRNDSNDQAFQLFCQKFDDHSASINKLFEKIDKTTDHCASRGEELAMLRTTMREVSDILRKHEIALNGPDGKSGLVQSVAKIVTSFQAIKILFASLIGCFTIMTAVQQWFKGSPFK